ncbi:hypothetical protein INR49_024869 [Caranx melampygus]|nr:hypothetical protein INR49_024869 [Caranx melampygus]
MKTDDTCNAVDRGKERLCFVPPRAPTSGYLIRGVFTKLDDKPTSSSTSNGIRAPHTVRSALENNDDQLSQEEKDKRSKENPPDTITPSFVAKRVEILDDDDDDVENTPTPAPASSPPPSPVAPITSVASAPQPRSGKIGDTTVKTASNEPVTPPKVEEAASKPVEEEPAPVSVTKKIHLKA